MNIADIVNSLKPIPSIDDVLYFYRDKNIINHQKVYKEDDDDLPF